VILEVGNASPQLKYQCTAPVSVTKFNQAGNEACNRSSGKCIFSWCGDSRMGTEIRLLLSQYTICAMIAMRLGHPSALHENLMQKKYDRFVVNAAKAN